MQWRPLKLSPPSVAIATHHFSISILRFGIEVGKIFHAGNNGRFEFQTPLHYQNIIAPLTMNNV